MKAKKKKSTLSGSVWYMFLDQFCQNVIHKVFKGLKNSNRHVGKMLQEKILFKNEIETRN